LIVHGFSRSCCCHEKRKSVNTHNPFTQKQTQTNTHIPVPLEPPATAAAAAATTKASPPPAMPAPIMLPLRWVLPSRGIQDDKELLPGAAVVSAEYGRGNAALEAVDVEV
jgi:hypothetical protein